MNELMRVRVSREIKSEVYLVAWTTVWKSNDDQVDEWCVFENLNDAQNYYEELIKDYRVYTASVCVPIQSTDYPTKNGLTTRHVEC